MRTTVVGRIAAIGAVLAAAIAVAVVLLGSGGGRTYFFEFQNAAQLVKGDQVKVGGLAVGSVKDIQLTKDGQARIKVEMNGDAPTLRQGTQASVRLASLSGVANRYIDLDMAPGSAPKLRDGAQITPRDSTTEVAVTRVRRTLEELGLEADVHAPFLLRLLGIDEGTERLAALTPDRIKSGIFSAR